MTSPTLEERINRAECILCDYRPVNYRVTHELAEVLRDLMHWADFDDLDFGDKLSMAEKLYATDCDGGAS